jgi:hypothetical protein
MRYAVYDSNGDVVAKFAYRDDAVDYAENYHCTWGVI